MSLTPTPSSQNIIPSPPCGVNVGNIKSWISYFTTINAFVQSGKDGEAVLMQQIQDCITQHQSCVTSTLASPPCLAFAQYIKNNGSTYDMASMSQYFTQQCSACLFQGAGCQDAYNLMTMFYALLNSGANTDNASTDTVRKFLKLLVQYNYKCPTADTTPLDTMDISALQSVIGNINQNSKNQSDWKKWGRWLLLSLMILLLIVVLVWWRKNYNHKTNTTNLSPTPYTNVRN